MLRYSQYRLVIRHIADYSHQTWGAKVRVYSVFRSRACGRQIKITIIAIREEPFVNHMNYQRNKRLSEIIGENMVMTHLSCCLLMMMLKVGGYKINISLDTEQHILSCTFYVLYCIHKIHCDYNRFLTCHVHKLNHMISIFHKMKHL